MRTHRRFQVMRFPRSAQRVLEIVRLENLAAARIEPALFSARGALFADVTFAAGRSICTIPFIELQTEMLDLRESSPFIWPSDAAELLDHETLTQIENALLPWIESLCFNRTLAVTHTRILAPDFEAHFDRAARSAFLGAAPYAQVFTAAAPYIYAARYANGKRVAIADAAGATGAALLSRVAAVSADLLDEERSQLASEWFDQDLYGKGDDVADVRVVPGEVPIATPVPMDVAVSFDREDAPAVRSFAVQARPVARRAVSLPSFPARGGSHGRILLLVRDDFARSPDADTDRAQLLAQRLAAEGFEPSIGSAAQAFECSYDLVHICAPAFPEQLLAAVRRLSASGVPLVTDSAVQLQDGDALWGPAIFPQILRIGRDETNLEDHLQLLAARKLETPVAVRGQTPVPDYESLITELRVLAGACVPVDPAFLPPPGPPAVPEGTPAHDFVLAHAPVNPRSNLFMVARGAAAAGLPLVIAGPLADLEYAAYLKAAVAPDTVFLPEPAAAQRAGLYAQAKVYADLSWLRLAGERLALAAAVGCAVVQSPGTDPGSEGAIAAALRAAWETPRPVPQPAPADPLSEVAEAYARASTSPARGPK